MALEGDFPFNIRKYLLLLLLILQSFDWLTAFHLELLQAILFIAYKLSAPTFLATCFKVCSRDLPKVFFFRILHLNILLQHHEIQYSCMKPLNVYKLRRIVSRRMAVYI